jgi:hypothetical protein
VLQKQLQLQSKRESNKQCQLKKEAASGQSALCCAQHQTE